MTEHDLLKRVSTVRIRPGAPHKIAGHRVLYRTVAFCYHRLHGNTVCIRAGYLVVHVSCRRCDGFETAHERQGCLFVRALPGAHRLIIVITRGGSLLHRDAPQSSW